jgi:hypothetical protein
VSLLRPLIVAPDTSHWANWIDAALSDNAARRHPARTFHQRLLDAGRIPFLSWHHLEELLCIESAHNAVSRVAYLQSIPLISWMRFPDTAGLGAITDILAAEAMAFDAGCSDLIEVRDHVRSHLLRTGSGVEAVGRENWVWDVARPMMRERRPMHGMVTALADMRIMDERQTFGRLANQPRRSSEERRRVMAATHARVFREAIAADPTRRPEEARAMADSFMANVMKRMPRDNIPPRDLMLAAYVSLGLDPDEVTDERTIAELSALATFRNQLHVVAENANVSFDRLKRVPMEKLPSWRIGEALKRFGQQRTTRPGGDMHDRALAVLAAYTDVLYVDKRTHEDFRRVIGKAPELAALFGTVSKASRYDDIAS